MGHKDKTKKRQSNIYTNWVAWQHPISQNPMTKLNQIQNQSLNSYKKMKIHVITAKLHSLWLIKLTHALKKKNDTVTGQGSRHFLLLSSLSLQCQEARVSLAPKSPLHFLPKSYFISIKKRRHLKS